jgi:integrase/recombinase XerC
MMKLSTAIKRFDTQLQADGKSEHTRGAYLRDLIELRSWLDADPEAAMITTTMLAGYLVADSNGSSAISRNRTKTALRMFFKFLTDAGYLEANPARLIKNGRTEPKTPEYLKQAEARRFLTVIPTNDGPVARRDRVMFTLLLQTGIRLGALVKLQVKDVREPPRVFRRLGYLSPATMTGASFFS